MGMWSSIGSAVGGYFGGTWGAAAGGAIGGAIDGDGKNAKRSSQLSAKATEYLEKQGKTAEEIKSIASNVGAYESVFKDFSGQIEEYGRDYREYGADYQGYENTFNQQAGQFGDIGDEFAGRSGDMWDRYTEKFQPVQDMAIDEVMRGPQTEQQRGIASADVTQAFDVERERKLREQQRYGINPNSGRADVLSQDMALNEAVTNVGARNKAAREEDDRQWAKMLTVNQMGAALPGQATSNLRSAGTSYGQAVNTTNIAQDSLGRQVDMTGKELGAIGASMDAQTAAKGAIIDEANVLGKGGALEGDTATGYGAQATGATNAAIRDSRAEGQVSATIGKFASNLDFGGGGSSPGMADDWTDSLGYGVG